VKTSTEPRDRGWLPGELQATGDCALLLLTEATDMAQLARVAERLAREHADCPAARLEYPVIDHGCDAAAANSVRIELAGGRACLHLSRAPARATAAADAWLGLVELRARELLAADDLQRNIASAQRNEHLQHALYTIADLAHSELDLHDLLARVHRVVGELTYADNFYIALYDDARDTCNFAYYADEGDASMSRAGPELTGCEYPNSLTFAVLHGRGSLLGPSQQLRHGLGLGDDPRLGAECESWLGVPMVEGGRMRGAVVVQSYDPARLYSEEDRSLLAFVAQHILGTLTRKQAQDELEAAVQRRTAELAEANRVLREEAAERERAQRLQAALFRIAELASEHGSLNAFYRGVHEVMSKLLDARNFFIAVLSEDGSELSFPYFVDELDKPLQTRTLTNGITERVLRERRPLLITADGIRALVERGDVVMFGSAPECWLGVPLLLGERAVGAMVVQSYDAGRGYGPQEQEILQFASFHIAAALERKQNQERLLHAYAELEQRVADRTQELKLANDDLREQIDVRKQVESRLQYEALHDALTGLPNRTALLGRLASALAHYERNSERLFAVLFLDLDRFKVVNDSVGHLLGDELLIEAGRRISNCVRAPDSIARLGGDEFTILLENIRTLDDACQVANRVLAAFTDPIRLGDKEIYTSASIGIALAHPRYSRAEELLRDADVAMYRAKAHGRHRFEIFDEQLREQALRMLDLESDLRRAIARREFEPFLQPIVNLSDGSVLGYEALLRWRHSSRGLLLPIDFLSAAEDSGMIEQIDWYLYEQVFRAIPSLDDKKTYVGINVSARHFRSPHLATALLDMIAAYRVPPWRVRVEVTEGALLENPDLARATMLRLREAGVLTSLDDFGTGYSSLSYLHRFPLHALKIDRSFVAELQPGIGGGSAAVVRAIRALAGSLNLEVIAEGVETLSQRDALMQLDCAIGQGYLFASPQALALVTH
jgi:diguanylate cyclase (GGDEF)-like protein